MAGRSWQAMALITIVKVWIFPNCHGCFGIFVSPQNSMLTVSLRSYKENETSMRKGDIVIADHPESRSIGLTRFYGIVLEITKTGSVVIELADGSVINRQVNSIAVYIHPPSNWQDLFKQQEIAFSHPRQAMFNRSSKTRQ